jgi:hypothetical protein
LQRDRINEPYAHRHRGRLAGKHRPRSATGYEEAEWPLSDGVSILVGDGEGHRTARRGRGFA